MLVLTRKQNQDIDVPDYGIKFRVLEVQGKRVRIGIEAPSDVQIIRSELVAEENSDFEFCHNMTDCRDPDYVWPLGVQFMPERAPALPKNRIHDHFVPFEVSRPSESQLAASTMSH